jgi:hypothetical protein
VSFPDYYQNLFLSSIFLPTGLLMLTIGILKLKSKII